MRRKALVKSGTSAALVEPYREKHDSVNFTRDTVVLVTDSGAPDGHVLTVGDIPYFPVGMPAVILPVSELHPIPDQTQKQTR